MEKIKKLMTILAIAGTVLVTLLFLYYPLRNVIREWTKSKVSLQPDEPAQEMSKSKAASKEQEGAEVNQPESSVNNRDVTLQVQMKDQASEVALWREEGESTGYFFLPAYAASPDCEISISEFATDGYIQIGGKTLKEGDVLKDIEWDKDYSLQIYGKEENLLVDATVIFRYTANLPTLFIDTKSGNMDYIHEDKRNEEEGQASVYDIDGKIIYRGGLEKISGRGNSTWTLEKRPYSIKLEKSTDLFGFGKSKTWNLLANGYDDTQMRNELVLSMGEKLGLSFTPQGTAVSLYCNGEYAGSYYLCEKVQVGEDRVDIRDLEAETASVYQNVEMEKLDRMETEDGSRKWVDLDYNPDDISGGYLIERELEVRYNQETISGFKTEQGEYYSIISPEHASFEQVNYIANLVQELEDATGAEDGINPQTGKHYSEYIDMDSFVKKYLVEEISKNYDGGATSSFFYKPADSISTKLFAGPLWDYDVVFGNCNLDDINSNPMGITMLNDHIYGTDLFKNLYQQADFKEAVKVCYQQEAVPILDAMQKEQIEELSAAYSQAIDCNNIRWQSMVNRYRYYETFEDSVRYLKHFIGQRKQFLDDVWIGNETYHCLSLYVDEMIWKRIYVKDGEAPPQHPIPISHNGAVFIKFAYRKNPLMAYDQYRPIYSDMDFDAQWAWLE